MYDNMTVSGRGRAFSKHLYILLQKLGNISKDSKGSHREKKGLVMEFFRNKGGGVLTQSITFEAHFCASRVKFFF